jgi:hypothetical protein
MLYEKLKKAWNQADVDAYKALHHEYNHIRPHQSLGMRSPIPETTTLKLDQT